MPAVSVIIPVYNGAAYVEEALKSALSQEGVDFEVVVSDNASTDDTVAIVSRYDGDPRLRILTNENNLGIFGNLNRLVDEARSPLIKILCADDWILPGGLAKQVDYMKFKSHLAFSRCLPENAIMRYFNKPKMRFEAGLPEELQPPAGLLAFATFGCLCGNLTNVIARKDSIIAAGGFDPTLPYSGDYDMWSRLAETYNFGLQNEELVHVFSHDQQCSVTLNKNNELTAQTNRLLQRFYDKSDREERVVLKLHWAIHHVASQWNRGFNCLREGQWRGFRAAWFSRSFTYSNPVTFIIWLITLNGRIFSSFTTKILSARIHRMNACNLMINIDDKSA